MKVMRPARTSTAAPRRVMPVVDEADKKIITQLQADGRRSYTAIASAVGLSEAAVRQRVKGLVDGGVIQIVAVTDPLRLGFGLVAFLALRVSGDIRQVADALAEIEEIDYVVLAAGRFDIICEVVCEDNNHLLRLLNDHIRTIPGVSETETFISLGLHKQTYTWGTR
ncbi:MAG: Lrp/AsnC family transcriptional regulator, regulator for asnA, asnC and gidA [Chloroflexota bacterium]|jgi:Lrp/AsnC family transcriptional regulator for asnA, asnC and gidA|nr:Lrp/AsnC family transcriptional regulator, regulator for asnA, asnC and gidA [Chloroflexota bacterium]